MTLALLSVFGYISLNNCPNLTNKDLPKKILRNTTWGVFKAYAFFFWKEKDLTFPKIYSLTKAIFLTLSLFQTLPALCTDQTEMDFLMEALIMR